MAQVKYFKAQPDDTKPNKANTAKKVVNSTSASRKRKAQDEAEDTTEPASKKRATKAKVNTVETKKTTVKKPTTNIAASKKAAAPKKAVAKKITTKASEDSAETKPATTRKRKVDGDSAAQAGKKVKALVKGPVLQEPPTEILDVYVFGEGSSGELALGTSKKAVDVKRPRLNPNLTADKVGVVAIVAGGMHCIALTHDNKVLTWGVNDQGTLGRSTEWEGGLRDMDAEEEDSDDDDNDDNGINPHECTPGEVDWSSTEVAEGTRFVQVAAGDSTSFVLTDDGRVYGWGCFRSNDGIFGFTPEVKIASRPVLIADLKNIVDIKAGANHTLAMDNKGAVFAWGSGQQNQLGRRIVERIKAEGLKPREFGLPKNAKKGIVSIETGAYHSFAVSKNGDVYAWGLNNFGETGIMDNAGQDDAVIMKPQVVGALQGKKIISIKGGGHHSLAATEDGDCLIWGRIDGHQIGISDEEIAKLPESEVIKDEQGRPRILAVPQKVPISGAVVQVAASSDHNVVITKDGKAWSWGFSANYQTGQGTTDDVEIATLIDNTATREKKLNGASTGGQFSLVTAPAEAPKANGA